MKRNFRFSFLVSGSILLPTTLYLYHHRQSHATTTSASRPPPNVLRVEYESSKSSILGEGTFGIVKKAKELNSGNQVALKVVRKNLKTLNQELSCLKKVKDMGGHPNVVSLLGLVLMEADPSKVGLVFELLEGGELYESLVKNGAYSENKAASVVRQIASALHFLHEKCSLIHGDLKPENILLRKKSEMQAVVCDFGSAVELDNVQDNSFTLSSNRQLGTVAYAAPELLTQTFLLNNNNTDGGVKNKLKKHKISPAVDVWSLGCILYVILSGLHPFDPDNELTTDEELAKSIMKGEFNFDAPVWAEVSSSAKSLIKKMLVLDPKQRITAKEVLKHDWISLPQKEQIISNSDKRLMGFLRTQKRIQDHVFLLMVDGSLKSGGRMEFPQTEEAGERTQLDHIYRSLDTEGKGFITSKDLARTLQTEGGQLIMNNNNDKEENLEEEEGEEPKLYYSSLTGLVGVGERMIFQPGQIVFEKGTEADSFYFVDRGKVEVILSDDGSTTTTIGAGDFFGETALLHNRPRNATIRAGKTTGAELIRFNRDDFDRLVAGSDTFKMLNDQVKKRTIEHVKYVFTSLFNNNQTVHVGYKGVLLKRGENSECMYYIVEGILNVISTRGEIVAVRHEGETVGELGLVTGEPRSMDIVCASPNGCALKRLDKNDLKRLLEFSPMAHAELTNVVKTRRSIPSPTFPQKSPIQGWALGTAVERKRHNTQPTPNTTSKENNKKSSTKQNS